MQNNQPVNNKQKNFKEGSHLVSTTDLDGKIEYVNQNFIDISGFSREELVGQNHHIVRHPDMPEAAFADLWSTIKNDSEWRGLVKNRCKDGGYYWVDAYVIPLFKSGKKVGYQSVRSTPSQQQIHEAETLYAKMRNDKSIKIEIKLRWADISIAKKSNAAFTLAFTFILISLALVINDSNQVLTSLTTQLSLLESLPNAQTQQETLQNHITEQQSTHTYIYLFTALASACLLFIWIFLNRCILQPLILLRKQLREIASGDLTQPIESNKNDEMGKTTMALKLLQARFRTIFGQFVETTQHLVSSADSVSGGSHNLQQDMKQQMQETNMVASAMTEMLASVGEVSGNALNASQEAASADETASNGAQVVNNAHQAMTKLTEEVTETAQVINQLAAESSNISTITETISAIADQTNLLALNAAIEAARAGEQGRGFAVVADEVRSLASRTQEATNEIQSMVNKLHSGIGSAVSAMEVNIEQVSTALAEVETSRDSFTSISSAINEINQMNSHIATATEQQQQVSEEMNQNVLSISEQSNNATQEAEMLQSSAFKLNEMALGLQEQLNTIDMGTSATEFDFEGAKQAHLAWKTRVRAYLDGDHSVLTRAQACSHHDCKLGLWYYGEGKKNYQDIASFREIEPPHAKLHAVIRKIVTHTETGNIQDAETLYQEMEPLSKKIVGLIEKTKNSIENK